jgi:hypothetical protein
MRHRVGVLGYPPEFVLGEPRPSVWRVLDLLRARPVAAQAPQLPPPHPAILWEGIGVELNCAMICAETTSTTTGSGEPGHQVLFVMFDLGRFEPRPFHQISAGSASRWITKVKRRSQYKCETRRKHDTKSHHNNCDWIISGNLEHRETPKIADRPAWSTTKSKTVQNCSDRTLQIAPTTEPHLRFSTMSNRTPRSEWIGLIDRATSSVDGIDATDQARL